jgi:methionyl-tRNA synthetase
VRRYNAELANDLGNLVNRTVSMAARYLDARLPALDPSEVPADVELRTSAESCVSAYHAAITRYHLDEALGAVIRLTDAANGYLESQAPWALNRAGERERAATVLAHAAETCRILGHLVAPFTPGAARSIGEQVGVPVPYDERGAGGPGLQRLLTWGADAAERRTGTPTPIFPRYEAPTEASAAGA